MSGASNRMDAIKSHVFEIVISLSHDKKDRPEPGQASCVQVISESGDVLL